MTHLPHDGLLVDLPCFTDGRGDLCFFEVGQHVPFASMDVAWWYPDAGGVRPLPASAAPGFLVVLRGEVSLVVPGRETPVVLDRATRGLLVPDASQVALSQGSYGSCLLICSAAGMPPASSQAIDPSGGLRPIPTETAPGGILVRGSRAVPFPVRRIYYLYNVPAGQERGAHAHRELRQLIVAVHGGFDVVLHDGHESRRVSLNAGTTGLPVSRMNWRDLEGFTADAVCLVLASETYSEADYIRTYDDYRRLVDEERAGGPKPDAGPARGAPLP